MVTFEDNQEESMQRTETSSILRPLNRNYSTMVVSSLKNSGDAVKRGLTGDFVGFSSSTKALWLCFFSILAYLAISVVMFSFVLPTKWSVIDSLYFAVVTFTTVGYGDLYPTTLPGELFCIFFVLFGILILGVALGIIGERLVEAQEAAMNRARKESQARVKEMFGEKSDSDSNVDDDKDRKLGVPSKTIGEEVREFIANIGPLVLLILVMGIFIGYNEGWHVITSIYFCAITITTVGYGDVEPQTQEMRLFSVLFIPISVAVLAAFLGRIAEIYMGRQASQAEKEFMERELTLSDLDVMDKNQDGSVDMVEFLSFMLVAMQKVEKGDIDELKALFRKLDADGSGELQKTDLEIMKSRSLFSMV